jgi:L-aspartate oxidase
MNPTDLARHTDFLVIGSGIAGLSYALKVSDYGIVTVITKKDDAESNTNYAQGGIASVMGEDDSLEAHIRDTLEAGAGLCHEEVVRAVVAEGPARVRELAEWGVQFSVRDTDGTESYDLGREGGHSRKRIVHAGDMTGKEIERALLDVLSRRPNVILLERHVAVDLVLQSKTVGGQRDGDRCLGAYVLDSDRGTVDPFVAGVTLLATGGIGKAYLYTTNPDIATGDGIVLAFRAGCAVGNMEFVQFHPTCLYHPAAKSFLISEAVRGEGAVIVDDKGEEFISWVHPMGSLAPRDVVARAIDQRLKERGLKHVYLDATVIDENRFKQRFPNIYETCLSFGFDMTKEAVPVVPAAHYLCGGIRVDMDGKTDLDGLYCCGESAFTGLHGANRLASNSLLEAVVFAHRAAERSKNDLSASGLPEASEWVSEGVTPAHELVLLDHTWDAVRALMSDYVGIVRSEERLLLAKRRIRVLREEIESFYTRFEVIPDLVELRNIALVAELIIHSALRRKESRGLHWLANCPERDDEHFKKDTIMLPSDYPWLDRPGKPPSEAMEGGRECDEQ